MAVRDNMSFALNMTALGQAENHARVDKPARSLQSHNLLNRLPKADGPCANLPRCKW